ncbi:unnamed protein product [Adineta steineri]|uniref:Uncharacterized protein n=1 Tax=Adineta steineri TaxID=433720 RepID=A0A814VBY6_9BILA|nr:unnamed protein product [Adineta steineri]CAF1237262.1 unnamed protein product [Adineta steineri]CAF3706990.1 unnamed protein product [Adineta steineri]CAF3811435.1 unnamed protein product [Adineta steineri]
MRPLIFPKQRLANSVDLRQWMPPIDNQQDMKTWYRIIYLFDCSCASAFIGLCNYLFKRSMAHQSSVSRLFIYYNGQMIQQRTLEVEDRGGYHGYFYLPYEYLTHPYLIDDIGGLWLILKMIPRANALLTVRRLVLS